MLELTYLTRFLRQTRSFRGLDVAELSAVIRAAEYREVDSGCCFCQQGAAADCVYALHRGRVKLVRSTSAGAQVLLRFLGPGEVFGATGTGGNEIYPFAAIAVSWCQVMAWKAETMAELFERYPRLAVDAISELHARMEELRARCCELATERVEQRVARVLSRLANQVGREVDGGLLIDVLSRQELAEMAGTTLYSVSRILSAWRRDGVVDAGRLWVAVLQPERLTALAADAAVKPNHVTAAATHGDVGGLTRVSRGRDADRRCRLCGARRQGHQLRPDGAGWSRHPASA
jgi:CRP-like cAMP-binding protein